MKRCTKCGEIKPVEDFYKTKRLKSGLLSQCKQCSRNEACLWAKENKKEHSIKTQRYRVRHREKVLEAQRLYRERHKVKLWAMSRALENGYVIRQIKKSKLTYNLSLEIIELVRKGIELKRNLRKLRERIKNESNCENVQREQRPDGESHSGEIQGRRNDGSTTGV